ncbi:MAG: hypothetical protein ACI9WU_003797 [Myxococcota bacterium]
MGDNSWNGREHNHALLNRGGTFAEAGVALGLADMRDARGLAAADYDRDGDIDFVINNYRAPAAYWVNQHDPQGWISITAPIGAEVTATLPGPAPRRRLLRLVGAGHGYLGQNAREQIISLGAASSADVTVRFIGGQSLALGSVTAGQRRRVQAPPVSAQSELPSAPAPSRPFPWLLVGCIVGAGLAAGWALRRRLRP